ncbi:MAG: S8 family serine peptidase [Bacteroidia bacterium]
MKLLLSTILLSASILLQAQNYKFPKHLKKEDYVSGKILVKFKTQYSAIASEAFTNPSYLANLATELNLSDVRKNFPGAKTPLKSHNEKGQKLSDLSLYYEISFPPTQNMMELAIRLDKTGYFEVIQPRFVNKPMAEPDDPQIGQQYHHAIIKTFEAWDVEEGDTTVLIGITDAGIQFDHQDLGNWQYNYADPENGIDDDNNGYIDDIAGWNTASNMNDPTATLSPHGMFTTGLSSATVNNGIGIAGNGYKCRFVPIRIDDANGFSYGYEGIVYAADRGCQIINASWGNTFFNPMALDVVNYATINQGALIIAASGNSGLNEIYYPASYPGVMSVGATGPTDLIWPESTFGPYLDIVAPGELLRSTWPFNGYDISSGTSFSAPLVAGAAALVKSHFPSYTAQQIAERLRVTADTSLFSLAGNDTVREFMGAGRLNMLRALTDPEIPSIRIQNEAFTDFNDDVFVPGDTIRLNGELFNYLADATNMQVTLSCESSFIEITGNSLSAGALLGSSAFTITDNTLSFKILDGAPNNTNVLLRLDYNDAGYHGFEYLMLKINLDYLTISSGGLQTTVTSRGNIGYNADYAEEGLGIRYNDSESLIYSSSFMLGTSANFTADNAYAAVIPGYDNDFVKSAGAQYVNGQSEVNSGFYTDSASVSRLQINQRVIAAPQDETSSYIRYVFDITNNGAQAIEGLHAGIFTDWELPEVENNDAVFDEENKINYAFSAEGIYTGWILLSNQNAHAYNFNNDGSSGSIQLYDGFSDSEKFNALSGVVSRNNASGEISSLLGTDSIAIGAGEIVSIRFALLAGNSPEELIEAANKAFLEDQIEQLALVYVTSNESCNQNDGFIQLFTEPLDSVTMRLISPQMDTLIVTDDIFEFEYNNLADGTYTLEFQFGSAGFYSVPFTIEPSPELNYTVSASQTIVVLPIAQVDFTANTSEDLSFFWDFADGNSSEEQNPVHQFTQEGTFIVSCIASNGECSDTSYIEILVGSTVGIVNYFQSSESHLMPNPANNLVQISTRLQDEITGVQVYDMSGKLVIDTNFSGNSGFLETRHLSEGLYMVFIQTSKGMISDKLLIRH